MKRLGDVGGERARRLNEHAGRTVRLAVIGALLWGAVACSSNAPDEVPVEVTDEAVTPSTTTHPAPSESERGAAALSKRIDTSPLTKRGASIGATDAEPETDQLPIPPRRTVRMGAGGATVGINEAVIVAGDMRLEVRANSLKTPTVVQIETIEPKDIDAPLPAGLLLAAGRGTPADAGFRPVSRWHIPLMYDMEPGVEVEVLAWSPQLLTWQNLGSATVNADGTHVVFFTMILGDVVVRRKPVRNVINRRLCDGPNFAIKQEWPGAEAPTVGHTALEERVPRDDAFAYMADFRLSDVYNGVSFKNEEVLGAWHRNAKAGQSYRDEDYLMDPNAAAALTLLQDLVANEWVDPYTGEAAVQVRLTEAYDSMIEHSAPSTHYQGRGLDITFSPVPPPGAPARRAWYGRLSRLCVCAGFDYVFFENLLHIHASVLPTRVATLVRGDDGRFGVLVGNLWAPERWRLLPPRWTKDELDATEIAWTGWTTLEIRGRAKNEPAMFIHVDTGAMRRDVRTPFVPIRAMQTGLQALVAQSGALYLANTNGQPFVGSGTTEANALRVAGPVQFPLDDWTALDAAFRPHTKTREAWSKVRGRGAP